MQETFLVSFEKSWAKICFVLPGFFQDFRCYSKNLNLKN